VASRKALSCPENNVSEVRHWSAWNTDYAGQIYLVEGVSSSFSAAGCGSGYGGIGSRNGLFLVP
jgi:hypothetical protein